MDVLYRLFRVGRDIWMVPFSLNQIKAGNSIAKIFDEIVNHSSKPNIIP